MPQPTNPQQPPDDPRNSVTMEASPQVVDTQHEPEPELTDHELRLADHDPELAGHIFAVDDLGEEPLDLMRCNSNIADQKLRELNAVEGLRARIDGGERMQSTSICRGDGYLYNIRCKSSGLPEWTAQKTFSQFVAIQRNLTAQGCHLPEVHVHKRSAFLPRHHPSLVSARLAEGGLRCNLDAFVEAPNPHSTKVHQWLNADAQASAREDRLTQHADMIGRRLSMHHGWGDSLGSEALQRHRVKMRWRQVWLVHAQTVGEPSSAEGLRRMVLAAIAAINDKYRAGVVRARLLCNSRDPAEDDFGQTARDLDEVKDELGYIKEERSIFLAALRELDACGDSSWRIHLQCWLR